MAEVVGLQALLAELEGYAEGVESELRKAVAKTAMQAQAQAKALAPVDTGRLRGSIRTRDASGGGEIAREVYTNVGYAPYVEFGTGRRGQESPSPPKSGQELAYKAEWAGGRAQPFMAPALAMSRKNFERNVRDAALRAAKRGG